MTTTRIEDDLAMTTARLLGRGWLGHELPRFEPELQALHDKLVAIRAARTEDEWAVFQ